MRKAALYSRSPRAAAPERKTPTEVHETRGPAWREFYKRRGKSIAIAASAMVLVAMIATLGWAPADPGLTQEDVDAAVVRALQASGLAAPAVKAYQAVRPSVVRVRAVGTERENGERAPRAVGSGVVIVQSGIILTNLHVVQGAESIVVEFANGHRSGARLVSTQPENDLAVVQAAVLPDDLVPATLGSAEALAEGDLVVAVGFPFGIGPSVSSGVVSGLRREYRSPQGERVLSDLIQFDAAANPGSSGGPLVNAAGEVVGIVTAIVSPSEHGTFAGIAFAVPIRTAAAAAGQPPF